MSIAKNFPKIKPKSGSVLPIHVDRITFPRVPGNVRAYVDVRIGPLTIAPVLVIVAPGQRGRVQWPSVMSGGIMWDVVEFNDLDVKERAERVILDAYDAEIVRR